MALTPDRAPLFYYIVIKAGWILSLSGANEFKCTYRHTQKLMTMGYKTISLSEEAYEILKNAKMGKESFSEVVIRLAKRRSLEDFVGCLSSESVDKLSDVSEVFRRERGRAWNESMEEMIG